MPAFSATKTRPPGANATTVGRVSPVRTAWSTNPAGSDSPAAATGAG